MHVQLAGFDLRKVEDVVDESQKVLAAVVNVREEFALAGGQLAESRVGHELRESDHGIQRRAQLVGHVREKRALGLRRLGQRMVGAGEHLVRGFEALERGRQFMRPLDDFLLEVGVQRAHFLDAPLVFLDRLAVRLVKRKQQPARRDGEGQNPKAPSVKRADHRRGQREPGEVRHGRPLERLAPDLDDRRPLLQRDRDADESCVDEEVRGGRGGERPERPPQRGADVPAGRGKRERSRARGQRHGAEIERGAKRREPPSRPHDNAGEPDQSDEHRPERPQDRHRQEDERVRRRQLGLEAGKTHRPKPGERRQRGDQREHPGVSAPARVNGGHERREGARVHADDVAHQARRHPGFGRVGGRQALAPSSATVRRVFTYAKSIPLRALEKAPKAPHPLTKPYSVAALSGTSRLRGCRRTSALQSPRRRLPWRSRWT